MQRDDENNQCHRSARGHQSNTPVCRAGGETRKRPPPSEYHADEQIPVYDCADLDDPFEAYLQKIRHRVKLKNSLSG